jgi:SEC-C motif
VSERRILLDSAAFLDSTRVLPPDQVPVAGQREIVQRYLACCFEDLGKAPHLLHGDEVEHLLVEVLPRRFGTKDPLAEVAEEVLRAFLLHLEETAIVTHAFEQQRALLEHADSFRAAVASGIAHREGLARTGSVKTIRHRAQKTGRNDPCPCGSGKKFKKCCMRLGGS